MAGIPNSGSGGGAGRGAPTGTSTSGVPSTMRNFFNSVGDAAAKGYAAQSSAGTALYRGNNPGGTVDQATRDLNKSVGNYNPPPVTVTTNPVNTDPYQINEKIKNTNESLQSSVLIFPPEAKGDNLPYVMFTIYEVADKFSPNLASNNSTGMNGAARKAMNSDSVKTAGNAVAPTVDVALAMFEDMTGFKVNSSDISAGFTNFALNRNIEKLSSTICLLAPDALVASFAHDYETISITSAFGLLGAAAQALASEDGVKKRTDPFIMEAASKLLNKIPGIGDADQSARLFQYGTTGTVVNPQLELLYNSPTLRSFNFDFRLVPRNPSDVAAIKNIIKAFKFYSSPTIPDGVFGRYFIPPAQFEIQFQHGDSENSHLFKTKKCVLKGLSVDYMPSGVYSTHADGSPMEYRLSMEFQETAILSRYDIAAGY